MFYETRWDRMCISVAGGFIGGGHHPCCDHDCGRITIFGWVYIRRLGLLLNWIHGLRYSPASSEQHRPVEMAGDVLLTSWGSMAWQEDLKATRIMICPRNKASEYGSFSRRRGLEDFLSSSQNRN